MYSLKGDYPAAAFVKSVLQIVCFYVITHPIFKKGLWCVAVRLGEIHNLSFSVRKAEISLLYYIHFFSISVVKKQIESLLYLEDNV